MHLSLAIRSRHARPLVAATRLCTLARRAFHFAAPHLHTAELSVVWVGTAESERLNHAHRGKQHPADVLSFSLGTMPSTAVPARRAAGAPTTVLGEIFLCTPLIRERAREHGRAVAQEAAALFVHGVLHLLGHDHVRDSDYRVMHRLEQRMLPFL